MSQIPRKTGIPKPRIVTASTVVTKKEPGTNITHTEQRSRIAAIQSCSTSNESRGAQGAPQANVSRFQSLMPQPPPCCVDRKSTCGKPQSASQSFRPPAPRDQSGAQSRLPQPGFSRAQPCSSRIPKPGPSQALAASQKLQQSQTQRQLPSQTQRQPPSQTQRQPPSQTQRQLPPQAPRQPPSQTQRQVPSQSMSQSRSSSVPPRKACSKSSLPSFKKSVPQISQTTQDSSQQPLKSALKVPTKLEKTIRRGLMNKSIMKPSTKVTAKAKQITKAPPENIETPAGTEPVIQKAVFQKRIERDQQGESLVKNLIMTKLNDQNEMDYVELGIQQLDPKYAMLGGKEIVGVTSTISISPSYATVSKDYIRALKEETPDIGMSPDEVSKLIEEEKEDVDNTLKMIPPELMLSPGKYEMKQRLQQLRLNSESVALLEQSIIRPEITPDEAQQEPSPEDVASVMHTVERGITPDTTPDQVFNSLFKDPPNEHFINLSSVTPGPLQDVVVPTDIPKEIHIEAVTNEMSKLTEKLNDIHPDDVPNADIFSKVMGDEMKSPDKGKNLPRTFETITDEKSLWVNANLEHLVNVVGAEPLDVLDPFDLDELEKSENLEKEMANGIEYFVEANPIQYMNRVQLRGSQLPSYFPGYMVAVPDFPDLIKIAKTPDEVFAIAWKSVQPKYFEEESMMSLLF